MKRLVLTVALFVLGVFVVCAFASTLVASQDPFTIPEGASRLAPSSAHWFGTDQQGRDIFSRVVHGARSSLLVGFGSALLTTLIGVVVGSVAAMRRGWLDNVLMRVADVFFVFPSIVLAACLVLVLGRGELTVIVALALAFWPQMARVVRGVVIQANESLYVDAARGMGISEFQIFRMHIASRIVSETLSLALVRVATGILAEAALSFLSIGVTEPDPSWGLMIASGRRFLFTSPQMVLFPAAAIVLTVGSLIVIHEIVVTADDV